MTTPNELRDLDKDGALPSDRAFAPSGSSPQAVSPVPASIPSAAYSLRIDDELDGAIEAFVEESNRIEGIHETTAVHWGAHWNFLGGSITIPALVELVGHLQPDARLRNRPDVPGVRVGNHVAPPSGPDIEDCLRRILATRDPWEQHVAYETLHPFTDGNGRSGRAIWLHRHYHEPALDPWAIRRGFLHSWYYHTLSSVRLAQGIEAGTGETEGLDAKRESPVHEVDAPILNHCIASQKDQAHG